MQKIEHVRNPDDTHCVQAVFKMVLQAGIGEDWGFRDLDEVTRKTKGKGTWLFPMLTTLAKNGWKIYNVEPFDYERLQKEGKKYIKEHYSPEAARYYLNESNVLDVVEATPEFLQMVRHENREALWSDLEAYVRDGYLVACDVNANALAGKKGFASHLVLVTGLEGNHVFIHDPDAATGPTQLRREVFEKAWRDATPNLSAMRHERMEHRHKDGKSCEAIIREVSESYQKGLILPEERPTPPIIVAPVGLIGSGKTTISKLLQERLPVVRIEGDAMRRMLRTRGEGYGHVHDLRKDIGMKYFSDGYSILFDSDGASGGLTADYEAALQRGLRIIWLHIVAPEALILKRLQERPADPLYPNAPRATEGYKRRKHLHEKLTMPFTYTFDTSLPLAPQIDEAVLIIRHATGWE